MNKPYSILLQKMGGNAPVKDSLEAFGIVCTDFPFKVGGETKELPKRDWDGEDGEDTYIPDKLPLKAYDLEVQMCYKGDIDSAYDQLMLFRDYLTGQDGSGATLKIYNSHTKIGRQRIYLLEMDDDVQFVQSDKDEVLTFAVKFRVTDPQTSIIPSYSVSDPTKVVSLVTKV